MDLHVLKVGHWVVEVVVNYVCGHVVGPFMGFRDEKVDMYLEVQ